MGTIQSDFSALQIYCTVAATLLSGRPNNHSIVSITTFSLLESKIYVGRKKKSPDYLMTLYVRTINQFFLLSK